MIIYSNIQEQGCNLMCWYSEIKKTITCLYTKIHGCSGTSGYLGINCGKPGDTRQ